MVAEGRGYGRGAAILSAGIGATGLITYAYFALASHSLSESEYGGITLLWSAVFITVSVLYRPVEQLLSRTIADRDARAVEGHEHLRVAATIQLGLGAVFVVAAVVLRGPLEEVALDGHPDGIGRRVTLASLPSSLGRPHRLEKPPTELGRAQRVR